MTHAIQGTHVHVQRLQKWFGARHVLTDIHLEVQPGEFLAVVGKSGCGKSTLLRLIAGLDSPNNGSILIDRRPLTERNQAARMMFQDARLLPWKKVRENVLLGLPSNQRSKAEESLQLVGLKDRGAEWPTVLSGGERQRVALARALAHAPQLLLLDEPLGALDALTRIEMQRLLERLWRDQGFTAILITHDVEEAIALADRVVLIEHGRIALEITVDLPRPRQRGSAPFAALKERVLGYILGDAPVPAPLATSFEI